MQLPKHYSIFHYTSLFSINLAGFTMDWLMLNLLNIYMSFAPVLLVFQCKNKYDNRPMDEE